MAAKGLAASGIDFFVEDSVSSLKVGTGADQVLPYRLLEVFEGDRIDIQFSAQLLLQVITMRQRVGWTTAGKKIICRWLDQATKSPVTLLLIRRMFTSARSDLKR